MCVCFWGLNQEHAFFKDDYFSAFSLFKTIGYYDIFKK